MGAGSLACQAAFTSDAKLVCRDSVCDLAHTTNILSTSLKSMCAPYEQGTHPTCCTTSLTLADFETLVATMPRYGNVAAANMDAYTASMETESWRTTVYEEGGCFALMTHVAYIQFAVEHHLRMKSQFRRWRPNSIMYPR